MPLYRAVDWRKRLRVFTPHPIQSNPARSSTKNEYSVMGQQQLLLLVLSIVIMSIAVYAGIDLFDRAMRQRHADLLVSHTVQVASEAVVWYSKGSPFLGGGSSYADLGEDGLAKLLMNEKRPPGILRITFASVNELEITAVSSEYEEIGVRVKVEGIEIVEITIVYDGSVTF